MIHVRHRRLRIAAVQLEPITPFRWLLIPAVIASLPAAVGKSRALGEGHETARVHIAAWWRGGMAACSARAAAGPHAAAWRADRISGHTSILFVRNDRQQLLEPIKSGCEQLQQGSLLFDRLVGDSKHPRRNI